MQKLNLPSLCRMLQYIGKAVEIRRRKKLSIQLFVMQLKLCYSPSIAAKFLPVVADACKTQCGGDKATCGDFRYW